MRLRAATNLFSAMTVDIRMKLFKMSLDRPSDEVLSTVQRAEMVVTVPVPPVVVDVIGWNAVNSDNSCSHLRGKASFLVSRRAEK